MAKPPRGTLTQVEKDRLQFLKARFDAAHAEGRAALERGDFRAAATALRVQREIIDQQHELIQFRGMRAKALKRQKPPPGPERVAWTLVKLDQRVELVVRSHPLGTELRCVCDGKVRWSEFLKHGPDHPAVQRAVDDTRAEWQAKDWCEPASRIAFGIDPPRQEPALEHPLWTLRRETRTVRAVLRAHQHGVELDLFAKSSDGERLLWSWVFPTAEHPELLAMLDAELLFWADAGFKRVESHDITPTT